MSQRRFRKRTSNFAPDRITRNMVAEMVRANIPPAKIYAVRKTGMLLTENNFKLWDKASMAKWRQAINEYALLPKREQ